MSQPTSRASMCSPDDAPPVVDVPNFLRATRDTGYKSTSLAIAELIDNSIQADATVVAIHITKSKDRNDPIELTVVDDGCGMEADTLRSCLRFGGTSRFDDRSSLGRFGMGLPNGSLSRARRIEVCSWRDGQALGTSLDLDDLVANRLTTLPEPDACDLPVHALDCNSGTMVALRRCDRIEFRRPSTLIARLHRDLGRIYRHPLRSGLTILINGDETEAIDPLMLGLSESDKDCAQPFGEVIAYTQQVGSSRGTIEVRFSELPVAQWHALGNDEKRERGITGDPGVSIVRSGREVAAGWYFMGGKRRENYDDWWRCEIQFDPCLDEMFGITHSKQSIRPSPELNDLLSRDLEPIARALSARVRRNFDLVKMRGPVSDAEKLANRASRSTDRRSEADSDPAQGSRASHSRRRYNVSFEPLAGTRVYETSTSGGTVQVTINSHHPFYTEILAPLATGDDATDRAVATNLTLFLLAMAGAETDGESQRSTIDGYGQAWSDILACFLDA